MKNLIFTFLVMVVSECYSQTSLPKDSTGRSCFTEVIKIDSVSKLDLYNRAKYWVTNINKNPQKVIQLDDKDNATIVVKAVTSVHYNLMGVREDITDYSISIFCKDNRFKYIITDFYMHEGGSFDGDSFFNRKASGRMKNEVISDLVGQCNQIINSLKTAMKKTTEASSD